MEAINNLKQSGSEVIQESIHSIVISSFKWIAKGVIDNSYSICLITCLLALLLYIGGQKKAGKYVSISFIVYFTLQALRGFVK